MKGVDQPLVIMRVVVFVQSVGLDFLGQPLLGSLVG